MENQFQIKLSESELHALEIIIGCIDITKIVNTNTLALSLHHLKLSDIFLTVEKLQEFVKESIKREDE